MAFTNLNECRNSSLHVESGWKALSGATATCSEVIVVGPTDGVYISDGGGEGLDTADPQTASEFFVPANTIMTFRGLTNAGDLSAKRGSSTDRTMYYRTQYYGSITPVTG